MVTLLRVALLLAIAVLLTEAVVAVASGNTGWAEKAVIVVAAVALVVLSLPRVRRLRAPRAH